MAAYLKLRQSVRSKVEQLPSCRAGIESRVARLEKERDRACKLSAQKEWGGGSMEPTAEATCAAVETRRMGKTILALKTCSARSRPR